MNEPGEVKRGKWCAKCHRTHKLPPGGRLAHGIRRIPANGVPEAYDDGEVRRLHQERLRAAYEAYLDRIPRGFKPVGIETWLTTVGSYCTFFRDDAWRGRIL